MNVFVVCHRASVNYKVLVFNLIGTCLGDLLLVYNGDFEVVV